MAESTPSNTRPPHLVERIAFSAAIGAALFGAGIYIGSLL
jgi:hypothetical protein